MEGVHRMRAVVQVDKELCAGTGMCEAMSPELFRLTSAGYSVPTDADLHGENRIELAREVAGCCPTEAIEITTQPSDRAP